METRLDEAFREIERLIMAAAVAGDAQRYDDYVDLFTEEGVLAVQGGPRLAGRAAIRDGLLQGAARRGAEEPGNFQRHNITTRQFEAMPDGRISGTVYLMVMTELGLDHCARYADIYALEDGRWRFAERIAKPDWFRPDSRFLRWLTPPAGNQAE